METIVKDHLISRTICSQLYQFGFVPGRSCTTQLLHVLDYFTKHLDKDYSVDVIYLDSQKAFDTVPHQRLIHKLSSFGIHGKMLQWIKDFLKDRTQEVVLNGKKSNSIPVKSGVPQGSVLGPILFTMFVNDLRSVVSSPMYMFADDTKIFRVIRTSEDYSLLQHDLDLLYEWSIHWQLKFNILKCKHMHLGPMHHYGPYYLDGTVIDNIDRLGHYLGPPT